MANGVILWRGTSRIDNRTPVVCIATGLRSGSSNSKTGAMVQTYIIRADMEPVAAVSNREDGGICGGCVHRKQENGKRTCYVNVGQGPTSVYRAFKRGRYPVATPEQLATLAAGKFVRLGTYGDPAAVPVEVWQSLTASAGGYTGYTHQWRVKRFGALASLCQASCETDADVAAAHAAGYAGTFRVLPVAYPVPDTALHCPASEERGKVVQCIDCRACDGSRDVVIYAHGPSRNFYNGTRKPLPVLATA
jgi:hypothetical protein